MPMPELIHTTEDSQPRIKLRAKNGMDWISQQKRADEFDSAGSQNHD